MEAGVRGVGQDVRGGGGCGVDGVFRSRGVTCETEGGGGGGISSGSSWGTAGRRGCRQASNAGDSGGGTIVSTVTVGLSIASSISTPKALNSGSSL